jgi:uncharacterized damage-inducible protein DinB
MPVPTEIANAAGGFRMNANLFEKSLEGLSAEEWQACPNQSANALIWIAGHIVWARSRALGLLGADWSKPWLGLFARGTKPADAAECPSSDEVIAAWHEAKAALDAALENISSDALSASAPERIPSFDGKLSGTISFFAIHESYHVGQAAYVRKCLGHGQTAG